MKLGKRSAGALLHLTSLPGPHGIGDLGPGAHQFIETLAECGQSWWQMLPINPPGMGGSPYNAVSAFAGNPMLLSLETLAGEGWLDKADLAPLNGTPDKVDFDAVEAFKLPRLRRAFHAYEVKGDIAARRDLEQFRAESAQWLEDYALFAVLRRAHHGASWIDWETGLRRREPRALESARRSLDEEIRFELFLQHQFSRQWKVFREHAHSRGIGLIGDLPIYVAHDSADIWSHPELFWVDADGRALKIAGVPPDYFSKTGQLWGNPIYRWEVLRKTGFAWWVERIRATCRLFDTVRLDHFIGFHNYWEIPGGSKTAESGHWVLSPGVELFTKIQRELGPVALIAEDLGVVTPEVKALRERFHFPGLRVLQMAFGTDPEADTYKPHGHVRDCVVYTGSHDNDTTLGWFNDRGGATSTRSPQEIEREHEQILRYVGTDGHELNWDFIRLALMSVANTAIIPVQDLLGLGSEGRMNLPGTASGNWHWRLREGALTPRIKRRWAEMTRTYGRASAALPTSAPSKRLNEGVSAAAIKISAPPNATI